MKRTLLSLCAILAAGSLTSSFAAIQVAGTLQVDVDATGSPVGPLAYLPNNGALGGVFIAAAANSNATTQVAPQIIALAGNGTRGILLDGNNVGLRHYTDTSGATIALPSAGLTGANPVFSVEAWMYKSTITAETGPVAWGNRAVAGQNVSCNWGRNIAYGGFSWQGGAWDHGWNTVPAPGTWHHLVWTYDGAGNLNLYRDGVLDKAAFQASGVYIDGSTNNIVLGVQHAGTGWFGYANGVLAKVRVHDGVLTPAQVANNYSVEAPSFVVGTAAQDLAGGPAHRYSFNQPATNNAVGLTVPDTGITPGAAAIVRGTSGNASFDGDHLNLNGGSSATSSYVDLPNFLVSSQSSSNGGPGQITFEMWVNPTGQTWTRLFDFGTNHGVGEITAPGGTTQGRGYIMLAAQVNTDLEHSRVEVYTTSGSTFTVGSRMVTDIIRGANTYTHYVVSWDEASNLISLYNNGVVVGSYKVAFKMNDVVDVNNWLGRSAWNGDNNMGGAYREFRIYNRVLNSGEVRRNYLAGPADTLDSSTLVWNGNVDGNWNTTTANWLSDVTPANYTDGSAVRLDDTASGTTSLTLSGTLSPSSVTVANETKSYAIGGAGKLSGPGGLTKDGANTLTFSGAQVNDYTGPTLLNAGKTVVSVLANAGSPSALGAASANPTNLVLKGTLSYQGSPAAIDRGILFAGPASTIEVLNSLTLSGAMQGAGQGGFAKTGPGTLVFANTTSNMLSGGAGPGFNVVQGTVVFDGTASGGTQTNRNTGELWVGGTISYPGHMVVSNSTLLQDTWLGIGRGNGAVGNVSTMKLENGRVIIAANGLAMGYQPGYNTNFATQTLTLNGASTFYIPGNVNVGESSGSSGSIFLNGSSWLRGSTIRLGISAGSTGAVTLANSTIITNANYTSIGTAAATAVYPGGFGTMVVRDNAAFYCANDFNVSDVGGASGGSAGQLDVMNNAIVTGGTMYIGKGQSCYGVLNQSGGTVTVYSTAGNAAILANAASSSGTMNISGGSFGFTNSTASMVVGNSGNGILTVSGTGALSIPNNLIIGNASGGAGSVYLNGGTLTTKRVYMGNAGASSGIYFDGGTLTAAPGASADFLSGLSTAYVSAGGARINTAGNDITIAQDLYDLGGGGLTKLGLGTLTLSGYPYYVGPTIVSGGKLATTTRAIGTANITVADGAELSVAVQDAIGSSISPANLTAGTTTGAALTVGLGNFGNPVNAPINVSAGTLTANGTVTVSIDPNSSCTVGEIPLISYGALGGSGTFVLGTLPPGVFGYLTNDTAGAVKFIGVVVTSVKQPRWEGLAGGNWDILITTNWIDTSSGLPDYFYQGSRAVFNDQALGTTNVNLVTTVSPGGVVVSNSALIYTISGAGRISGNAGITKLGTSSLTLSTTNNNYTGTTLIDESGTLVSTVANNLGTNSALVISNASTLSVGANNQRFASITLDNGTIAASGATVTSPNINLNNGSVNAVLAGGTLTTFGTNNGTVTVLGNNTYTGRTVLAGSTLAVPNLANGGTASGVGSSSANPTNLVFAGGGLSYTGPAATTDRGYTINGGGTFSASGNLTLLGPVAPGTGGFNKSGPAALIYARPGTNILGNAGYFIGQGTVVFDGGASTPTNYLQTNRINGDVFVGYDQVNAGAMVLTNTSVGVSAWVAMDRGNGTVGSSSKLTLYDSVLTSGNFSMGYANGIAGNSSFPVIRLLGNSSFTVNARTFIGENTGADATIVVAGNSRWVQNSEWFGLGNQGRGTLVLSNNAFATFPGDYNLGDVGGGDGTLNIYDNATNLAATVYVGKGNDSGPAVGVVNQYGGFMGRSSGGGDWRIGGNSSALTAGSVGLYNLHGGILQPNGNFQIGAWGTGNLNLYGGRANCSSYPVVGRFPGGIGTLFVSGGVFDQTGGGQLLIIGEEGTGTLTVTNSGVVTSAGGISIGHTATGNGTVNLDGGTLATTRVFQNGGAGAFSTFNFNGGVLKANANNANFMAGLTAANVLARGAVIDTTNFNVTIDQLLAQDLISTGGGLTKFGAGALTLSAANTYTGPTTINAGALVMNGSIPGTVTVKSGAGLGGNGTVGGVVTVESGGAISAGTSIGALTLNASPVLNGAVVAEVNRNDGITFLSDLITVVGNPIAYSGSLVVTNAGPALVMGDTFKLFTAASYSGSFTLVSQTPGQIVTWNTGNLTANGTITVLTAGPSIPTTPTNITVTVSGGNIQVWWPTNYTGWRLEAQTNALTVGLSNNWGTWPGSTSVNVINMPIDPAAPTVFFRLVYP